MPPNHPDIAASVENLKSIYAALKRDEDQQRILVQDELAQRKRIRKKESVYDLVQKDDGNGTMDSTDTANGGDGNTTDDDEDDVAAVVVTTDEGLESSLSKPSEPNETGNPPATDDKPSNREQPQAAAADKSNEDTEAEDVKAGCQCVVS